MSCAQCPSQCLGSKCSSVVLSRAQVAPPVALGLRMPGCCWRTAATVTPTMLTATALVGLVLVCAATAAPLVPNAAATTAAPTTLSPADPRIKYHGRIDRSDPQRPQFAWVMTGAACTFTTSGAATISASFTAPKDGARVRVMIDGELAGFVKVEAGPDDGTSLPGVASNGSAPAGYTCAPNMNYEGEQTCFKHACPKKKVSTVDACAELCNSTKGCTVLVHNNKDECYLKSDYSSSLPDDPSLDTVSCATHAGHHPPPPPSPAGSYPLGSVTAAGTHTIEVFKVTEDNSRKGSRGSMGFGGFSLGGGGGTFGPAPPPARRRLEFIGDSDTAGWCADGR
eukprot:COSAG01_NODE_14578_length_1436_cov_1.201197_1_plen_338_part_10